jgi:uncharacterized phage protein (TIGR01671 family)
MRAIRFRGKSLRGGYWYYGNLFDKDVKGNTHIGTTQCVCLCIDPDTVGQFTGLTDSQGHDIYEGDIVQWEKDGMKYVVTFRNGMFYASVEEFNKGIYGGFPLWVLCEKEQHCVIVGNIHDNPELLEQREQCELAKTLPSRDKSQQS